jgi:plasmid stability protein
LPINDCNAIIDFMAAITIRNLDDETKARLRVRAARHQRSMEEEARTMLRQALAVPDSPALSIADAIQRRFRPLGGVELETVKRERIRVPPRPEK